MTSKITDKNVESLEDDFVIEKVYASEGEEEEFDVEAQTAETVEFEEEGDEEEPAPASSNVKVEAARTSAAPPARALAKEEAWAAKAALRATSSGAGNEKKNQSPVPAKKAKKEFVGNSKRAKVTFEDLGIQLHEKPEGMHAETWTVLLDKLYEKAPKPLYVKSHTKVKVLIVCSNALRCLEIIKELRSSMPNVLVAKLFARHLKVPEQIELLKENSFLIGVGTAGRIAKIIETDPEAIKAKKLEYVLVDSGWRDKKSMSILDLPETQMDLKKLVELVKDDILGVLAL